MLSNGVLYKGSMQKGTLWCFSLCIFLSGVMNSGGKGISVPLTEATAYPEFQFASGCRAQIPTSAGKQTPKSLNASPAIAHIVQVIRTVEAIAAVSTELIAEFSAATVEIAADKTSGEVSAHPWVVATGPPYFCRPRAFQELLWELRSIRDIALCLVATPGGFEGPGGRRDKSNERSTHRVGEEKASRGKEVQKRGRAEEERKLKAEEKARELAEEKRRRKVEKQEARRAEEDQRWKAEEDRRLAEKEKRAARRAEKEGGRRAETKCRERLARSASSGSRSEAEADRERRQARLEFFCVGLRNERKKKKKKNAGQRHSKGGQKKRGVDRAGKAVAEVERRRRKSGRKRGNVQVKE
ncbi:hypothetical protein KFL_011620010 [Klebsormidium nitens]|uniref:Uncharacterized protein n=1 Tax=Klebsormidium nitens TaxID=105231 RepID=A0A1Y1IQ58_KLENI|nr:hypothetical protein KFL_011620010 [Klebsormidium nitens]|eukprot:GAQ92834.1 hypothetical protein KFL_011620010 [Klebsormidium nitens]